MRSNVSFDEYLLPFVFISICSSFQGAKVEVAACSLNVPWYVAGICDVWFTWHQYVRVGASWGKSCADIWTGSEESLNLRTDAAGKLMIV